MGTFYQPVKVGKYAPPAVRASDNYRTATVPALVGAGALFSIFPESFLLELGIAPESRRKYRQADGSLVEYGETTAMLAIGDAESICPVIFGPEGRFVLGKTALENLFLRIDDAGERLVPLEHGLLVGIVPVDNAAIEAAFPASPADTGGPNTRLPPYLPDIPLH